MFDILKAWNLDLAWICLGDFYYTIIININFDIEFDKTDDVFQGFDDLEKMRFI